MADNLLPLFPLNLVLFPNCDVALHIFEERYKEMIGDCLDKGWEFGIVLAQEQNIADTGCTASIQKIVRKYPDGRLDILVRGRRRFQLLLLNEELSYLRGEPQFFEDDTGEVGPEDSRRSRALELFGAAAGMVPSEERSEDAPTPDDAQLSFQIMSRLPAELPFKQNLLNLRSEDERLSQVVHYLQRLVKQLTVSVQARARAGRNGHHG